MHIQQCRIRGKEGLWELEISDGRFQKIRPQQAPAELATAVPADQIFARSDQDCINAQGRLLLPPFVEPHIHLDCVLTAGQPHYNMSGTLFEGISTWDEYKTQVPLEVAAIKDRARQALRLMAEYGVQFVRSHVDVTEASFKGVQALLELREELRGTMEIQLVAFPQNGILSTRGGKELMIRAMEMGVDCVGGIPHYEFSRDYGVDSLKFIFDLAEKYDAMVDVHCDEMDDEQSRYLEVLATEAWERGWGPRTVAAHTCAMGSYNDSYYNKLLRVLQASGIHFNACPTESIHLQGRTEPYPKRRGITRIKELSSAGLNVALGQDSIADPWYPIGTGNPLRVLDMGLHVGHLLGYQDISHALDFISVNGARNLCLGDQYGIMEGRPADFILLDAKDDYEALRFLSPVLLSVHNGKILAQKQPARAAVYDI
ncbi:cytosine deaminase [Oscillospiraceae bacterium HV4-5-C5C]|nr:cytosine deaminase [Oscillospiraceae bacterium HV4-5-C5C]